MLDITKRTFLKFISLFSTQLLVPTKVLSATEENFNKDISEQLFPSNIAGKMTSLHDYMSSEELADANSDNPQIDHSEALRKALRNTSFLYLPAVKGAYRFKDVELPDGVWLIGNAKLPYMGDQSSKLIGCGSAIIMADGGECIFKFNNNVTLFGLALYGNEQLTSDGVTLSNQKIGKISNLRFLYCGFYGFRVAIGNKNKYMKVDVNNCVISANKVGVYNIVDSKVFGGSINGNTADGVLLNAGANDNTFLNVKVEWNAGSNFKLIKSVNNIISSCISDRAGQYGILLNSSQVVIDSSVFRRNSAKISDSEKSAHIILTGNKTSALIRSIKTVVGRNDDKSGQVSPKYSVICQGDSSEMKLIISDSDLTGVTGSSFNFIVKPDVFKNTNNITK
ncbi:right-handed parallel beta-helix repeat-containing protein [Raoultella planticola]|uniref:right-handed parallel beta-helix repeat-containing protein n=1 Tax=Raoultella planticola TaxID=575 RepID=UPI001034B2B3|nr:right-handed parallel beta-helix repeat-containing protein [Raoultella planticola]